MTAEAQSISEMRALALAKLLLTERDDLQIVAGSSRAGYDLLVRVLAQETASVPEFAVEIKATREPVSQAHLRKWIRWSHKSDEVDSLPLCLFVFQVETREGRYCWLREPRADDRRADIDAQWEGLRNGDRRLVDAKVPKLLPLGRDALDRIVSQVIEWTKARERAHMLHARAS